MARKGGLMLKEPEGKPRGRPRQAPPVKTSPESLRIGEIVRLLRMRKEWSQTEAASRTNGVIPLFTWCLVEQGYDARLSQMIAVCRALGVKLGVVLKAAKVQF